MRNKRRIIYLAGFLFSISIALVSYINSSFLENFVDKKYVGIVYTVASLLTLLGLLEIPKVLTRLGNRRTIVLASLLLFFSFLLLAFGTQAFIVIPAFFLYFIAVGFIFSSLDIFMEVFSSLGSVGGSRGLFLMIINLAWVVSQVISGSIISNTSFGGIYLLSSLFILAVAVLFTFSLKSFRDPIYTKVSIKNTVKAVLESKKISKIYYINLVLQFFYAFMVIYTPIYLHEYMGFGWDKIGIMFSIMLLPFVLLDYPLGKISDKMGEKKLLITGLTIILISVLCIPFIKTPLFPLWALVLFATRVGAATVETMSEAYFFKVVDGSRANIISFFRGTFSLSYIIAPMVASLALFVLPSFEYLFFVLAVVIVSGIFVSIKIKDVR